ncbi:MAG: hypothetical protein ACK55A_13990 [Gemmatimonas sp.]
MGERSRPLGGATAAAAVAAAVAGRASLLLTGLLMAGCDPVGGGQLRWVRQGDVVLRETHRSGRFADDALEEASGAVVSVGEPGVFWSQNDSGNDETLFAFDSTGRALGRVDVKGVRNRDWEALATGPCSEGQCVTIGDVGDNAAIRGTLTLYQLAEPRTTASTVRVRRSLDVRYADGSHDVEAMYAGADGGLWLVTKRPARGAGGAWRPVRVYHVPRAAWEQGGVYTAAVVDSLPLIPERGTAHDWVTDASLSAPLVDGRRRLALLSYGAVHVFDADPATGRPGALVARCALPIREDTAEGLTWLADGRLLVVTEGRQGAIYVGRCP